MIRTIETRQNPKFSLKSRLNAKMDMRWNFSKNYQNMVYGVATVLIGSEMMLIEPGIAWSVTMAYAGDVKTNNDSR